jgi:putative flippase GtrA
MVATKYIIFAIISTFVNIFLQYTSFAIYDGFLSLYVAISFGTLGGLIVKYILDKKYIFNYEVKTKKEDGQKFALYSLMGVFTTLIFWGFEIGFDMVFGGEMAKYAGGTIGLAIGYITKYQLDKRFVFGKQTCIS